MKKILQCSIFAATLFTFKANAQLDSASGNVFLKAAHVEAGMAPMGWFGSTIAAPTGYHADFTSGKLGFVADPDLDGWAVGSPAYFGDYFLPGSPFEGWEIQIDSLRGQAFNGPVVTTGLTGSNISYTSVGSVNTATWLGSFNGVTIKQETSLDTNANYYVIKITLTNNDSIAHNNIYYLRSLDPDNDQMQLGGGFPTNNKIIGNPPTDSFSLVSAVGQTYNVAYMGLGSADTNSRALIYTYWPISTSVDLATVYNGTCTSLGSVAYSDSLNGDVAIGLIINVGHLAPVDSAIDSVVRTTGLHPANSASFTYFYSFNPAASDSALANTRPIRSVGITNSNTVSVIRAYPNPAKTEINVTGLSTTQKIQLTDMTGRVLKNNWAINDTYKNVYKIDDVPNGIYFLIVKNENGNIIERLKIEKY